MSTKRVLYIEDNAMNLRLVRRLLTASGYTVIEANDGLKGIAVAARERPDLILMDINLPGIDGMEATSRLKSSIDLSHIPIVALTAVAMKGDRERILASGCDDYLQKPIDNALLIETVCRYIGKGDPKQAVAVTKEKAISVANPPNEVPEASHVIFLRKAHTGRPDDAGEQPKLTVNSLDRTAAPASIDAIPTAATHHVGRHVEASEEPSKANHDVQPQSPLITPDEASVRPESLVKERNRDICSISQTTSLL